MKKYFFFLLFLAVGAMSCQKDIEQGSITAAVEPTDTKQTSLFDQTRPVENDDVYIKIDAFKAKLAKIEAGTLPENDSGTSVDDAIWNIEALLNNRYGQAGKPFDAMNRVTNTIRLSLNDDGTIANADLAAAYEAARQKLSNQYHAIADANKHVIGIDISKKESQAASTTSVLLDVTGVIGLRISGNVFNSSDNWLFAYHAGKCDNGGSVGTDAADRLFNEINFRSPLYTNDYYFTNIQTVNNSFGGFPNPNDATPGDNIRDFLFFKQTYYAFPSNNAKEIANSNYSDCINSSDMNFYYNSGKLAIDMLKPSGKTFISIYLYGDVSLQPNFDTDHLHIASISYGILHYSPGPMIP
jgi:hypothetical protein